MPTDAGDSLSDDPTKAEDDGKEHFEIQGALQAAHRATLHMPDGKDIELDLAEQHQDGTADYNVWGIEDTDPGDGERSYRNRVRLFCDAQIIGASDSGPSTTVTLDVDTEDAEAAIDRLQKKVDDLERDLAALNPGGIR